jgi:eukaryotic-like serine/threonine-protein kinase
MSVLGATTGTVIADRYALGARIGAGGMGAVYEATHVVTGRPCAIKLMLGHTADREELRERFFRESRALAQIGSEYIVDVLDAGVDPESGVPFLVMERLHGIDLGRLIAERGALTSNETLLYLWQAALALDRTHRSAIVHRDLKASNLFLTEREDGTPLVKVLDFGVAKIMRTDATSEGGTQAVGTPMYMAPEQFRSEGRISASTDIYALGLLAYLMLVGKHYWREEREICENPYAFAAVVAGGPREVPSLRAAGCGSALPGGFDAWFARATAFHPEDRFGSATEAITALAGVLDLALPATQAMPPSLTSSGIVAPLATRDDLTADIGPMGLPANSISQSGSRDGVMAATISLPNLPSLPPPPLPPPSLPPPRDPHSATLDPATEMPLVTNATNAQLSAMRRPRRRAGVVLVLLIAAGAGVTGAVMFESAIRPPAPLNKTLARHWMVAQQLERVTAPQADNTKKATTEAEPQITESVENSTTLTPEDLGLVPPTPPADPVVTRHRPTKRPARGSNNDKAKQEVAEQPPPPSTSTSTAKPEVENPERGKSRREQMYRRD